MINPSPKDVDLSSDLFSFFDDDLDLIKLSASSRMFALCSTSASVFEPTLLSVFAFDSTLASTFDYYSTSNLLDDFALDSTLTSALASTWAKALTSTDAYC